MKKIEIKIPHKTYPVYVGANSIAQLPKLISAKQFYKNVFVIADRKVLELHHEKVEELKRNLGKRYFIFEFDGGEKNKSAASVEKMYSALIQNQFGRDTLIIAIGGGITGDIAGYVASTFTRGVQLIQVSTTLLAAVDSSVGGKTGINFGETKNIVGTFYQPEFVLIDSNFLKTLPDEELICGVGEILKYAFLTDVSFFDFLNKNLDKLLNGDDLVISKIIEKCVRFKGDVVTKDETESGLRKILNLGHTFAHAIEVEQNYAVKHGQAVAVGLTCALYLSKEIGLLEEEKFRHYLELPLKLKNKVNITSFNADSIYQIMRRDKKGVSQKIRFVLLKEIGKLVVDVEVEESKVFNAIHEGISCFLK